MIEQKTLEKLAEAEIQAWIESSAGNEYIENEVSERVKYLLDSGSWNADIGDEINSFITKKFQKMLGEDHMNIEKIFTFGMTTILEKSGYEVTIKKKGEL